MPYFRCKVVDALNNKKVIIKEATDELTLRAGFKRDGTYLLKCSMIKETQKSNFFAVSSKVNRVEVINFLRQFSVMSRAGIPISSCLNTLRSQKYGSAFKRVLQQIYLDIESGVLLSNAFAKHPKVFPKFFVSMVAIGEVSGSLDNVLANMADYYENDRKIKKKAKSAMVYPSLLLGLTFIVVLFINLFILPKFQETISELGGEAPRITIIVMSISAFLQDNIFIIIPAVVLFILLVWLFFKTEKGKFVKDFLLYHMPVIGKVQKNLITSRFSKAFIILIDSGMTMVDCLENLKKMLGNKLFSEKFNFTIEEVKRGRRIAVSLEATKLFPDILTEMISVGEESGNIQEVLKSSSNYFDECVESSIASAIAALEPVMIVILGLVVGVVIISVLLPIMSLMNSI